MKSIILKQVCFWLIFSLGVILLSFQKGVVIWGRAKLMR